MITGGQRRTSPISGKLSSTGDTPLFFWLAGRLLASQTIERQKSKERSSAHWQIMNLTMEMIDVIAWTSTTRSAGSLHISGDNQLVIPLGVPTGRSVPLINSPYLGPL